MLRTIVQPARAAYRYIRLPGAAKLAHCRDTFGFTASNHGIDEVIDAGVAWLGRAQDSATPRDGGVARHFGWATGWSASYPETTGYIVPTMLQYAELRNDAGARQRAGRMLDWLVSIQLPSGAYQGGVITAKPCVPVTFNTGQILIGLASGVRAFGERYRSAMRRAADWLVDTQDADGCWRRYPTPFAATGDKAYETHVAWGLLEAASIQTEGPYATAALANIHWALRWQQDNGWFERCCLTSPERPLSHTIGYVLRGLVEAYRFTRDPLLLHACRRTADGLLTALRPDGFLPGRLLRDWRGAVRWACLTGSAQIAACWLLLFRETGDSRYKDAAYSANRYVRHTIRLGGPPDVRGAVAGAFPISGDYCSYEYPNWACKFAVDAHMLEREARSQ